MKRIVRLTESDLARIVRRVIKEEESSTNFSSSDLATANSIIDACLVAFKGDIFDGTYENDVEKAIKRITTKNIYNAVLNLVKTSKKVRSATGNNYDLVGDFLSTDMTFAAGHKRKSVGDIHNTGSVSSPWAEWDKLTGYDQQLTRIENWLKKYNSSESIKIESFND
jgi:hypothetical protein